MLLTDLSYSELEAWVTAEGHPSFRARQVFEWVYRSLCLDFQGMTNLPLDLRRHLAAQVQILPLRPVDTITSLDGLTTKDLFELPDGSTIEAVLMQYQGRHTVCVSTQVGCAMGCSFCATGQSGFVRNLSTGEIVSQALYFARQQQDRGGTVSNIVFMGMGEPLANYEAVWKAIRSLNDRRGFGLGARRFTVSTAGVVPGIRRMADEGLAVGLAVSLHAAEDALRDRLVPLNRTYPLKDLLGACDGYAQSTRRRVTFEYAMIDGVNDSRQQGSALAELLVGKLCHVNLIPLNPTADCELRPSSRARILAFRQPLNDAGIPNTIRLSRGIGIQAGCGQLRSRRAR